MKKISRAVGIVLAGLMILAPTAALATAPPLDPDYKMSVVTYPATVAPGETFTATVVIEAPVNLMSAQFKMFTFNHELVEIVSVRGATGEGEPWFGATYLGPKQEQIDEANADGTLDFPTGNVFWTQPPGPATPGKFVIITMRAKDGITGTHTVELAVDDLYMLNANLEEILDADIKSIPGQVVVEAPLRPEPDLTVPAVTTDWVVTGETYTVTFTINNWGTQAAESTAAIYIDGLLKATAEIPALAARETHTATAGPFVLTAGEDTIRVYADHGRIVAEYCELNNYKELTQVGYPDLIVSDLNYHWLEIRLYHVFLTIKNQGDIAAPSSTAVLKIDGRVEERFDIPALAPGETHTVREGVPLTEGEDEVRAYADYPGYVRETNELNNFREITVERPELLPDLVVFDITTTWYVVGEKYYLTFTMKNEGVVEAAASTAAIYIDGVEQVTADIPALALGRTYEVTTEAFTLTEGYDTIKVYADRPNVIDEADEGNNHKEKKITAIVSDLIVREVTTEWIMEGKTYTVTFTVANEGAVEAAASTAVVYIDGAAEAAFAIPALAPAATHQVTTAMLTGTYPYDTIKVYADHGQVVTEANEDNNHKEKGIAIVQPPPPVRVPDLVVIPEGWSVEWVEGGQYKVTFTIKNQGEGDAAASTAGIEIDGEEKATAAIPALAAGKTHTATTGPFTLTNGRDIVKVIADRDNVVAERGGEAANHLEWAVEGQKAPWGIIAGVIGAVVIGIAVFAVRRRTS
ncbi:hypothetical protein M1N83_03075 [Dehalococcoidia bacterium]|nr:hypothetical protein [Dehalococcoidia bacterium]